MKDEIDTMMMRLQNNVALMQRPHTLAQRVGADNDEPKVYRMAREGENTLDQQIVKTGHDVVKDVTHTINPLLMISDVIKTGLAYDLQKQENELAKLHAKNATDLTTLREKNSTHLAGLREGYAHQQKGRDHEYNKLLATHADNQEAREEETKQIQKKHEKEMHEATQVTEQHRIKADAEIAGHQKDVDIARQCHHMM
jgi:hypothetical protein